MQDKTIIIAELHAALTRTPDEAHSIRESKHEDGVEITAANFFDWDDLQAIKQVGATHGLNKLEVWTSSEKDEEGFVIVRLFTDEGSDLSQEDKA